MRITRTTWWISLVLLPIFFLLHNFNELFGFIPPSQLFKYGLIIYLIAGIGFLLLRYFGVPKEKAALVLLLFAIINLFFEPTYEAFKGLAFGTPLNHLWVILFIYLAASLLLIWKIFRTPRIPGRLFSLINLIMIVLVATELFTLLYKGHALKNTNNLLYPDKTISNNYKASGIPDSSKPDIYFLVFDEYTNSKTLKQIWNFNNEPIMDWLAARRFYTPKNSHANYTATFFSVPSTFNMNFIDATKAKEGVTPRNLLQAERSLSDNETFSILEKENYEIRFLAPFRNRFQENGDGQFFDFMVDNHIEMQTLPGRFISRIKWDLLTGNASKYSDAEILQKLKLGYDSIRYAIAQIKNTADDDPHRKPRFVYGHLFITHGPHIFDSTGSYISQSSGLNHPLFDTYISQVRYANSVIQELVTYIMSHARKNTIILIEGDHGFRGFYEGPDFFRETPDSLKRFFLPNFSAFYFPDTNYSRLYDNLSPVNTFRIVFNQYFHQNLPLLKDTGFIVKDQ